MTGRASAGRSAFSVGAGVLISRISGFVRDVVIAATFGLSPALDAYVTALYIPNLLRNLLGEGTLSAAFVPLYSRMLKRGRDGEGGAEDEARRLARGVLGVVVIGAAALIALGVAAAPLLVETVAPEYEGELRATTVRLIRILFPMAGVMVLAAWCLAVLNSHRRFFLPFVAPVLWNLAQIAGLLIGVQQGWEPLIEVLAWSTLVGSVLQLLVQLPTTGRLAGTLVPRIERGWQPVRTVVRRAGPVAAGQGVFQISGLLNVTLANTVIATTGQFGAVSALYFAQRISQLPIGLFGVSVATAALPEMSREARAEELRAHVVDGLFRVVFFVLPCAVVLFLFGDVVVQLLYQRNQFRPEDVTVVRWVLGGYAIGLVASSLVRLFASAFHALQDTRTPMKIGAIAVAVGVASGAAILLALSSAGWGLRAAAGLALGTAIGSWINLGLLWRGLVGRTGPLLSMPDRRALMRVGLATLAATALALPAHWITVRTLGEAGTLAALANLAAVAAAGAVGYFAVVRRPPTHRPATGASS